MVKVESPRDFKFNTACVVYALFVCLFVCLLFVSVYPSEPVPGGSEAISGDGCLL